MFDKSISTLILQDDDFAKFKLCESRKIVSFILYIDKPKKNIVYLLAAQNKKKVVEQ